MARTLARVPIFGPNYGFTTWTPLKSGTRSGVTQLTRIVTGMKSPPKAAQERLTREDQLPAFLAQRIYTTAQKVAFSSAQIYAEGHWYSPLSVEGAEFQRGRGTMDHPKRKEGNKVYLSGTEAAHFGYGTVKRQGEALSMSAAQQVILWQKTSGYPSGDPRAKFAANGALAALGLDVDASTFLEPAFMNQIDALLERPKQDLLKLFMPRIVPASAEQLEVSVLSSIIQVAERFAQDKAAVIRPLEDALVSWKRGTGGSIFARDPMDIDPKNNLFDGDGLKYAEALWDLHRSPTSGLYSHIEDIIRSAPSFAHKVAEVAEASLAERVDAPTYKPTRTDSGGE